MKKYTKGPWFESHPELKVCHRCFSSPSCEQVPFVMNVKGYSLKRLVPIFILESVSGAVRNMLEYEFVFED